LSRGCLLFFAPSLRFHFHLHLEDNSLLGEHLFQSEMASFLRLHCRSLSAKLSPKPLLRNGTVRNFAAKTSESSASNPLSNIAHLEQILKGRKKDKLVVEKDSDSVRVEFGNQTFWTHRCEGPKPTNYAKSSRAELLKFYHDMNLIRKVEIACDSLYGKKAIRGFLHLYNGQESIVSGYEASINRDDHVITAYRDHGNFLGRGGTPYEVFCELTMKSPGCSKGKGGSMHLYRKEGNFYGGNGIVGAQCPMGAGIAFSLKYRETNQICLTLYGDGAANQGQLYEAFNMAFLWKLPVVFICENNKYGMGTSAERSSAVTDYYTRGDYIPGLKIDAMNVLAVRDGMKYAADWCRSGKGPFVIEMETYRYKGHSMSDPGVSYRSREEIQLVQSTIDPIEKIAVWLRDSGLASEDQLKEIEKKTKREVEEALAKANEAPFPEPSALYEDVYTENSKPYYVRGVELPLSATVHSNAGHH